MKRADRRHLQALGYPEQAAKQLAREHNGARKLLKRGRRMLAALKAPRGQRMLAAARAPSAETVITLAQFAPPSVQDAGTVDWQPPATDAGRQPPGLDDSGKALHALIAGHAARTGQGYFHAMADVTGQPTGCPGTLHLGAGPMLW